LSPSVGCAKANAVAIVLSLPGKNCKLVYAYTARACKYKASDLVRPPRLLKLAAALSGDI